MVRKLPRKGGAPVAAGAPRPRVVPAAVAAVVGLTALAGCAAPIDSAHDAAALKMSESSAGRPEALQPGEEPPPLTSTDERGTGDSSTQQRSPESTASRAEPTRSPAGSGGEAERRSYRVIGTVVDPRGDHALTGSSGIEGPAYADVVAVSLEDDGTFARITVDVAADIPSQLASGEVMGVAVDLWSDPSRRESDFQLFAEGSERGWLAHLQTPRGLVDYPGEFRLGGRRLVFEVSWEHIGGLRSGGFRAFADWSKQRVALNAASFDRAPDSTPSRFSR